VSAHSNRPIQTIATLAEALHLRINDQFRDRDYAGLAADLLGGKYGGKDVLILRYRGTIPQLAAALGAIPP
jgi:hypothetical protein